MMYDGNQKPSSTCKLSEYSLRSLKCRKKNQSIDLDDDIQNTGFISSPNITKIKWDNSGMTE